MPNVYKWLKLASDNKMLLFWSFTALTALIGNTTQAISGQEKDEEILQTQRQVAVVADSYHKHYRHKEPVISNTPVDSDILDKCRAMVNDLRLEMNRKYH